MATLAHTVTPPVHPTPLLPIVLIHGFGGNRASWTPLLKSLDTSRQTVTLDLPGHGESGRQLAAGDLPELATEVKRLLDELAITAAHFVGHSMGAEIAVTIAGANSNLPKSVTLLSGAGPGSTVNLDYIKGYLAAETEDTLAPLLRQLFADETRVTPTMVSRSLEALTAGETRQCLQVIAGNTVLNPVQLSPRERLAALTMPLQIIWGDSDRIALREQISFPPEITVHLVEGAGHMAHIEQPQAVAALLNRFIDTVDR